MIALFSVIIPIALFLVEKQKLFKYQLIYIHTLKMMGCRIYSHAVNTLITYRFLKDNIKQNQVQFISVYYAQKILEGY